MSYSDGGRPREAYNEQVKLNSKTLQNFGVAVTIALVARALTTDIDGVLALMVIVALSLFATACKVLAILEMIDD